MTTNSEPRAMREIHDIRLTINEETRYLTAQEKLHYFNDRALEIAKKYNLKIIRFEEQKKKAI